MIRTLFPFPAPVSSFKAHAPDPCGQHPEPVRPAPNKKLLSAKRHAGVISSKSYSERLEANSIAFAPNATCGADEPQEQLEIGQVEGSYFFAGAASTTHELPNTEGTEKTSPIHPAASVHAGDARKIASQ
jgi:hypothetical protein